MKTVPGNEASGPSPMAALRDHVRRQPDTGDDGLTGQTEDQQDRPRPGEPR
ncbi:hypothetical protein [Planotetraspora phitsanulokensis]|uniref:hypothetical protein n=1 Tax=Planotetraspora phitsanulokensis TaxID=575192 RepID=UPI00194DBEC8|nr:hypothetical protein [Planotetraspora phitsanulokensis]